MKRIKVAPSSKKLMATPFYTKASPLHNGAAAAVTNLPNLSLDASNKKKTSRCYIDECKKKLGFMGFDCRCGKKFCGTHRMPEDHKCSFDYRAAADAILEKQLVKVINDKVEKI